tara:strand:- start:2089 stop:2442 length:354 start_codon:yes stop_codon:yes gene_type:complete
MKTMKKLSPMIPSTNMGMTKDFLVQSLGFSVVMDTPDYIITTIEGNDLHVVPSLSESPNEVSIYLEVYDVEEAWALYQRSHQKSDKVKPPFLQPYGMREFHVILPYTNCLIFVGQKK